MAERPKPETATVKLPPKRARRTLGHIIALIERDGKNCRICGQALTERDASVDHRVPLSAGGADDMSNWQLAHRTCNVRKGARQDVESLRRVAIQHLPDIITVEEMARRLGVSHARAKQILASHMEKYLKGREPPPDNITC